MERQIVWPGINPPEGRNPRPVIVWGCTTGLNLHMFYVLGALKAWFGCLYILFCNGAFVGHMSKICFLARAYSSWRCCRVFGERLLGVFVSGLVSFCFGR